MGAGVAALGFGLWALTIRDSEIAAPPAGHGRWYLEQLVTDKRQFRCNSSPTTRLRPPIKVAAENAVADAAEHR